MLISPMNIKNQIVSNRSAVIVFLLGSTVLSNNLATTLAHAQTTPRPGNAFEEGTERRRLTDSERQSLLEYAVNSKTRLERALQDGRGKALDEMLGIYRKAILQVVLESYTSKPRSELLLRHSLNQALQLTFGIPTPDGKGIQKPGVLVDVSNKDLILLILKDSIKLAIKYYEDDRKAVQSGNLISLPYVSFATDRITLILKWHRSVFETDLQYDLLRTGLNQWYSTVIREDQQRQTLFAEEIVLADEDLGSTQYSTNGLTPAQLASHIRIMRRDLRKISEGIDAKIRDERTARDEEERKREDIRKKEELKAREAIGKSEREAEERRKEEARRAEEERRLKSTPPPTEPVGFFVNSSGKACYKKFYWSTRLCVGDAVVQSSKYIAKIKAIVRDNDLAQAELKFDKKYTNRENELVYIDGSLAVYQQSGCTQIKDGSLPRLCVGDRVIEDHSRKGKVLGVTSDRKIEMKFEENYPNEFLDADSNIALIKSSGCLSELFGGQKFCVGSRVVRSGSSSMAYGYPGEVVTITSDNWVEIDYDEDYAKSFVSANRLSLIYH